MDDKDKRICINSPQQLAELIAKAKSGELTVGKHREHGWVIDEFITFMNMDFSGIDLDSLGEIDGGICFKHTTFTNCKIGSAKRMCFEKSRIVCCNFIRSYITSVDFSNSYFEAVTFANSTFEKCDFSDCSFHGYEDGWYKVNTKLVHVNFVNCDFSNAYFGNIAECRNANFMSSNMSVEDAPARLLKMFELSHALYMYQISKDTKNGDGNA